VIVPNSQTITPAGTQMEVSDRQRQISLLSVLKRQEPSYLPGASPTTRCSGFAGQSDRHASELASPV